MYNLVGLAVLLVGFFIFRVQGVICNVKDRLIDEARNRELDRIDRETFGVQEDENQEELQVEEQQEEIIEDGSEEKRDE